jgi:hypothetical protein
VWSQKRSALLPQYIMGRHLLLSLGSKAPIVAVFLPERSTPHHSLRTHSY